MAKLIVALWNFANTPKSGAVFISMTVEMQKRPVAQRLRFFQYECRYNRVRLYLFLSSNINYKQYKLYIIFVCVHFQIVCFPGITTHCGCIFHSPGAGFSLLVFEVS